MALGISVSGGGGGGGGGVPDAGWSAMFGWGRMSGSNELSTGRAVWHEEWSGWLDRSDLLGCRFPACGRSPEVKLLAKAVRGCVNGNGAGVAGVLGQASSHPLRTSYQGKGNEEKL